MQEVPLLFSSCKFQDNIGYQSTPNVYLNRVINTVFDSCNFLNTVQPSDYSIIAVKGNFIQIYAESNITIQGCTFSSGYALYGGALFILGEAIINL